MRSTHLLLAVLLGAGLSSCGVTGFVRYGLTQARPGSLKRGMPAPDVPVFDLDGEEVLLGEYFGRRPLVLIFGSFT